MQPPSGAEKMEALRKAKESEFDDKRKEFQQSLSDHVKKGFVVSEQSYEDMARDYAQHKLQGDDPDDPQIWNTGMGLLVLKAPTGSY